MTPRANEEKLARKREKKLDKTYDEILQLQDSLQDAKQDPRYKNMSHDELLYGEKGAWSTNNRDDDE